MKRLVLPLVLLTLSVTACSSTDDSQATADPEATAVFVDFTESLKEFNSFAESAQWPEGFVVPQPEDPGEMENPDGTRSRPTFQTGYGESLGHDYWTCAWQVVLLDKASQNQDFSQEAQRLLEFVDSEGFAKYADAGTRDYYKEMVGEAELGDFVELRSQTKACPTEILDSLGWKG